MHPSVSAHVPRVALILFAALAAGFGLWFGERWLHPPASTIGSIVLYPVPRPVPEFRLTRADGQPLDRTAWRGHWTLVYFGYASCPDVCPTTLTEFKRVWQELARRGLTERVRFDFISVDPARDTPERLRGYIAFFHPDFVAATGSDAELGRLARALGLVYARGTDADGAITVDHSGSVVLIDPDARLAGLLRPPFVAARIAADLAHLLGSPD
jgi:protein SCO1/2